MAENTGNSWIQTVAAAVTNALKAAADETVRENAEFAYESGLSAKIVRKMSGETCEWCRAMAGTYDYGSEPSDVYRRHDNCDCTVEYVVGKDRQNVHTKQWTRAEEADKIEERKQTGLDDGEMLRRKIGSDGREIIDKPTYQKLTREFSRNGGIIVRGEEAEKHLKGLGASASYIVGGNAAYIKDSPTVSDVLEEMYHAKQDREGHFGNGFSREIQLLREIEAQEYLIENAGKYKIPLAEQEVTISNLEKYKKELAKLYGNRSNG